MQPLTLLSVTSLLIFFLPAICQGLGYRDSLRCPPRVLKGGRVRIRNRGRVAKYICLRGFQVLGDKYSTCISGKWSTPLPVCINSGCLPVDVPHSQVVEMYKGALATIHCDPGYELIGSQTMYCNGARWNGSLPSCQETTVEAQKWCDFETEDLCGWTHDPNHDFDWRRHNFATPSGHVGTGPSYDHTLGIGLNGHYMYLETSSPRLANDTARLFSPYFSAPSNPKSCFIFWYHMFGLTTGTLNVYLHKKDTLLLYSLAGDQGDYWHQAIVPLPRITSNFQIVIEGVRGTGFEGDTAIDDVKLAEGDDCIEIFTSTEVSTEKADDSSSCGGRCFISPTHPSLCECTSDCLTNNTCCPDFLTRCLTSTTDSESMESTTGTQESNLNPTSSTQKVSASITEATLNKTNHINNVTLPHMTSTTISLPVITNYTTISSRESLSEKNLNSTAQPNIRLHDYSSNRNNESVSFTTSSSIVTKLSNSSVKVTTLKPLERKIIKILAVTQATQKPLDKSTTTFLNNPTTSKIVPPTIRIPLIFVPSTTLGQRFVTKSPMKQGNDSYKIKTATIVPSKQPQSMKPVLEFLTPPTIVFRFPTKIAKPLTAKILSTLQMINTTTTEKMMVSKTVKGIVKSKNDVFHPYWEKKVDLRKKMPESTTTVGTVRMATVNDMNIRSPSRRILFPHHSTFAPVHKWTSKFRQTTEVPPVHAPYAIPSSGNGIVHIVLLMCLLLLCVVLTTVVMLRRRKIKRSRLEDDELDIHFLASDEILDFTLSRPNESQVCETMR